MRWWDIPAVALLETRSYASDHWSEESFWGELAGGHVYRVAETDGAIVGYAGLSVIGDDGNLQTVAVDPEHRGNGIGGQLVDVLLSSAREQGLRAVELEVASRNLPARHLYEVRGFVEVGLRRGYYAADGDDAILMTATL